MKSSKKVAYVRLFGIPEIDTINRARAALYVYKIDGIEYTPDILEDADGSRFEEYMSLGKDKIITHYSNIVRMCMYNLEDADVLKALHNKNNIIKRLEGLGFSDAEVRKVDNDFIMITSMLNIDLENIRVVCGYKQGEKDGSLGYNKV